MDLGNTLWLLGICSEVAVVCLLAYRHVWKSLPIFSAYCVWDLANNGVLFPFFRHFASGYMTFYAIMTVFDTLLVFSVLIEISWSVLRPIQKYVSVRMLMSICVFFVLVGLALWFLTASSSLDGFPYRVQLIIHIQETSSLLRVLLFLILAASSQFLAIGWHDRELQVATGMAFYSLVSFGAMMVHAHETSVVQYKALNEFVVASYLCSLLYWVYSFAQKEAERREFTPQMQNVLLAMAGVAREQRLALAQAALERHQSKA